MAAPLSSIATQAHERLIADFILTHTPPGARVIDVGCGTGWTAILLTEHNICQSCEGVDIDELDIHRANKWFIKAKKDHIVHCRKATAEELSKYVGRNCFDVVVSNHSLHHYSSPEKSLQEIRKILKKRGVLLLSELEQSYGETIDNCPRYRPEKIRQLVTDAGFAIEEFTEQQPGVITVKGRK